MNQIIVSIRNAFRGCIAGAALGEVLGGYFQEHSVLNDFSVTDLLRLPARSVRHRRWAGLTEQMLLVGNTLRAHGEFRVPTMVDALLRGKDSSPFGWGEDTTVTMEEILRYFVTGGKEGRAPETPSAHMSEACAELTAKVIPLALFTALEKCETPEHALHATLRERVKSLCEITHGNRVAIAPAAIVAHLLAYETTCTAANAPISEALAQNLVARSLGQSLEFATFMTQVRYAFNKKSNPAPLIDRMLSGPHANGSRGVVRIALHAYLASPSIYLERLIEALKQGGDLRSIGFVTGALLGMHLGYAGLPQDLVRELHKLDEILFIADSLHDGAAVKLLKSHYSQTA